MLTGVFGTVSGVGIWFAIGLTHPEATSTLIHNFVFGWAIEWVFFLVELTTAAVYYYTWNKIDAKLHLTVGWVYAGASVCTLIIINGILTFMLTPGDTWLAVAGTGHEASKFWNAFFNPTYWPSLLLRSCVCASLAGIWALISASRIDGAQAASAQVVAGEVEREVAGAVVRGHAVLVCVVPVHGSRVAARVAHTGHRHYRLRNVLDCHAHGAADRNGFGDDYRRGVLSGVPQSCGFQSRARGGHSAAGVDGDGRRRILARDAAQAVCHRPLDVLERGARALRAQDRSTGLFSALELGVRWEFQLLPRRGHLPRRMRIVPHTNGYRPLVKLLAGRDRANIESFITMLHEYKPDSPYHHFMPPMVGTKQDVEDLTDFLNAHVNPPP